MKLESWDQFAALSTGNVSEGGVFVEMAEQAVIGQRVSIEVSDAEGRAMVLAGEVVHVSRDDGSTGIGVRFLELSDAEREIVELLVGEARNLAQGSQSIPIEADEPAPDNTDEVDTARDFVLADEVMPALQARLKQVELGDPFDVLGVPRGASQDAIVRAYKAELERWDPARFEHVSPAATDACKDICRALEYLRDEALRG